MEAATAATKSFNAPESKLHFLDYWRIIRIRKTVILAVFLLVAITTTLVTFVLPESFASPVTMKVEKDLGDGAGLGADRYAGGFDPYWLQTEFETIQSKSILNQVITNQNMMLHKKWAEKLHVDELPLDLTYSMLKHQIDVRQSRNTSLIEVRVISDDKNEAANIANEIAKVYKSTRLKTRLEMSRSGIKSLTEKWADQDKVVTNLQAAADKLRTELQITETEAAGTWSSPTLERDTLRKLEMQRIEAQTEYATINSLYESLTNRSRPQLKKAVSTSSPDQQLGTLLEQLATAEQKWAVIVETYGEEHPETKSTKRLLDQIRQQVDDRLEGILEGLRVKTVEFKAELTELQTEVEKAKQGD